MQLFAAKPKRHVLLFGSGLIGQAVRRALHQAGVGEPQHYPFDWTYAPAQSHQIAALIPHITGCCDVVWAAGKAGFGAPMEQLEQEYESFLLALKTLKEALEGRLRMHLISSAGGLYEGQRFVDHDTIVRPLRPYGQIKLKQEEALAHQGIEAQIYRPSSVFGYVRNGRQGFMNTTLVTGSRK